MLDRGEWVDYTIRSGKGCLARSKVTGTDDGEGRSGKHDSGMVK